MKVFIGWSDHDHEVYEETLEAMEKALGLDPEVLDEGEETEE